MIMTLNDLIVFPSRRCILVIRQIGGCVNFYF